MVIGLAAAAAGAGTMALFSDTESSSGNTVQAGTIDLGPDNPGTLMQSGDNLAPTQETTGTVTLTSDGSLSGSLDVAVDYTESDGSGSTDVATDVSAENYAKSLTVTELKYGGNSLLGTSAVSDTNGDGVVTLYELANQEVETDGDDIDDLSDPGSGTDFTVTLRLQNVGNDYQNDGVDVTYTFTLNQQDSQ